MKKFIAVAMIALLAVTSAFAVTVTGSAEAGVKADFSTDTIGAGFVDPTLKTSIAIEGATGSSANEGEIYAKVAGKVDLKVGDLGVVTASAKVTEASINGANWSLDILSNAGVADFAGEWFAYDDDGNVRSQKLAATAINPGMTATVFGYQVGFGGWVGKTEKSASFSVLTPTYKFVEDALTLQAGAGAGREAGKPVDMGAGFALAFAQDAIKADVALDTALQFDDKVAFDLDVAANFSYDPVTVNFYFATTESKDALKNYYSARVAADLTNVAKLPLTFGVSVLNIKKDLGELKADVAYTFDGGNAALEGGYNFGGKAWNAKVSGGYAIANVGKLDASVAIGGDQAKAFNNTVISVGLTNDSLISGATLSAKYETGNLLADKDQAGALTAGVTMKF